MDGLRPDSVLANVPLHVFVLSADGRFRFLNRAALGFAARDVIGRSMHEILALEDARLFDASLRRVLLGGGFESFELDVPDANGDRRRFLFGLAPFAENGRIVGSIGWAVDRSDEKGPVPDKKAAARARQLTPRQRNVLILVAQGQSNREIARKLGVSVRTVETHREQLSDKLELRGAAALTRFALAARLV